MRLVVLPETFAVCRLLPDEAIPSWALVQKNFLSVTYTDEELSIVCVSSVVPNGVQCERNWKAIKIAGPLDFSLIGILAPIATTLAQGGISIFALSTYDTDYILMKERNVISAMTLLEQDGHVFV